MSAFRIPCVALETFPLGPRPTGRELTLPLCVVALFLILGPSRCPAMMSLEDVSPERAKTLGMEVQSHPAGPEAVWIELSFDPRGELKSYGRVDLELEAGGKLLLSATLRDKKSDSGRITVSCTVARADLNKLTLRVVTGVPMDMVGHDLHMKNVVQ